MAILQHKTPGVYINEPNFFPPSIVGVETAVPAFIGYTDKAIQNGRGVTMIPVGIGSMAEYREVFGGPYPQLYALSKDAPPGGDEGLGRITLDGTNFYGLAGQDKARFYLYDCLQHFFANGGGECFIVSCSTYATPASGSTPVAPNCLDSSLLISGLEAIEHVAGPTMLLVPDATLLPFAQYGEVVEEMLAQCKRQGDRVALLDIWGGEAATWDQFSATDPVQAFRQLVGGIPDALEYGIAYFPFLNTSVVQPTDIDIGDFNLADGRQTLVEALTGAVDAAYPPLAGGGANPQAASIRSAWIDAIGTSVPDPGPDDPPLPPGTLTHRGLTAGLVANIPAFGQLLTRIADSRNILPPSPAMAGVITMVDATRGVWNAPANIGIAQLVSPVVDIGSEEQEDLNTPVSGLAINAIRTFPGRGTLVWGARTLAGHSNDWRYIQARRTTIYVEQSIKLALNSFVFGPNTATTWVTVVSMIESFLHGLWAAGGLMGATADQAFNVQAGLGSTMTAEDVLNGIMRVQVVLTMVHPAEFIELTFEQQMLGGA